MKKEQEVANSDTETKSQRMARVILTPEIVNAAVVMGCTTFEDMDINDVVAELRRQTAAINQGDLTRAENMLLTQANSLEALFAKLASKALVQDRTDNMDRLLRLALKAQNQSRATLQTLAELKMPKQVAFVRQANIGNQVQVNNGTPAQPARTRKTKKEQNELLEVEHGERLDTRTQGAAGREDPRVAAMGEEHRSTKRRR